MKKISLLLYLFALTIILCSCSDKEEPIGKWGDIIKLSTKKVEFDADSNSITITTEGDWWWVIGVSVNNEFFHTPEDINLESNNYIFQQDCFIVERKDKNTLFIEVDENQSNAERKIVVELEAGDYFDRITITQASE